MIETNKWEELPGNVFYSRVLRMRAEDGTPLFVAERRDTSAYEGWIENTQIVTCDTPEQAKQMVEDIHAIRVNSTGQTNSG